MNKSYLSFCVVIVILKKQKNKQNKIKPGGENVNATRSFIAAKTNLRAVHFPRKRFFVVRCGISILAKGGSRQANTWEGDGVKKG